MGEAGWPEQGAGGRVQAPETRCPPTAAVPSGHLPWPSWVSATCPRRSWSPGPWPLRWEKGKLLRLPPAAPTPGTAKPSALIGSCPVVRKKSFTSGLEGRLSCAPGGGSQLQPARGPCSPVSPRALTPSPLMGAVTLTPGGGRPPGGGSGTATEAGRGARCACPAPCQLPPADMPGEAVGPRRRARQVAEAESLLGGLSLGLYQGLAGAPGPPQVPDGAGGLQAERLSHPSAHPAPLGRAGSRAPAGALLPRLPYFLTPNW